MKNKRSFSTNKALFLDRDGVIIKMHYDIVHGIIDTPLSIKQVEFIPGIFELLRFAKRLGYLLIVITNQPGVGIKKISSKRNTEIKNYITKIFQKQGVELDGEYHCMHHPYASISKYRKVCICRKPKIGLLIQASKDFNIDLEQSWMIGDGVKDIIAGYTAGCKTVLVGNIMEAEYLHILEEKLGNIKPTFLVKNIEQIKNLLTNWYLLC